MRIDAQAVLNDLYQKFESNSEVSVSAPEYDQLQIDYLIESGLLTKNDVSTLSGWTYLVRPTYEGKAFIRQLKDAPIAKLYEFIQRGEEIGKKERRPAGCGFAVSYVSGPLYNAWMDEINIFNERYLKKHPMHDQIFQTYFHRRNRPSAYEDMMGHLHALSTDDEFNVKKIEKGRVESVKIRNQAVSRMLQKDINRCKSFLSDSKDESVGLDLYIEITSRYDSIIPNLGAGLYQCMPEQHWYDPEISGSSLIFNLKSIMNKMLAYQAVNYPIQETELHTIERRTISNKVFIVHGHDNAAIQEMARTLEKGGFEAIILHEQPDSGLTIIEKIERYADVDFAVVLYTECDLGRAKEQDQKDEKYRARQNVVFEHGYLIGKLGRDHVCALVKGNVETPGDISGVVYVNMDTAGAWKMQLGKNMRAVDLPVDLNTFCY